MEQADFKLGDLTFIEDVPSACECMEHCFQTPGCQKMTYVVSNTLIPLHVRPNTCFLKGANAQAQRIHPDTVSANVECCEYQLTHNSPNIQHVVDHLLSEESVNLVLHRGTKLNLSNIVHAVSGCISPLSNHPGGDIGFVESITTVEECQEACQNEPQCLKV